jgi:hypothetical protein
MDGEARNDGDRTLEVDEAAALAAFVIEIRNAAG